MNTDPIYQNNETPPHRRNKKRSKRIIFERAVYNLFEEMHPPMTVRQIYYALTVRGIVPKSEKGYRTTLDYLAQMREVGDLRFDYIADNTRWVIKPASYCGIQHVLYELKDTYRRDVWYDQSCRVEIWIEKDALASVIQPITEHYDVPLYVARGYSSKTFIFKSASQIKRVTKPSFIYHFGDFDPSGIDAANNIQKGLKEHGANATFLHVAITHQQIIDLELPTRETKSSDPRAKRWGDLPSVELDALPPDLLRDLVENCILRHIDEQALYNTKTMECWDREVLGYIAQNPVREQNYGGKDA